MQSKPEPECLGTKAVIRLVLPGIPFLIYTLLSHVDTGYLLCPSELKHNVVPEKVVCDVPRKLLSLIVALLSHPPN